LDATILAGDIAASAINTTHILDSTILTGDIAEGTILAGDLAPSAINNTHVLDNTLDFLDFAADLDLDESTNIDFGTGSNNFIFDLETGTGDFIIQDAGTMFAQFYDTGDIQLGNDNELYVDTSAGYVGIGVNDPLTALEVSGSIFAQPTADINTGLTIARFSETGRAQIVLGNSTLASVVGSASGELWRFGMTGPGSNDFAFYDGTQNILSFNRTSQDIYMVPSSGNVGIGTTTPANTLNVVGDANVTQTLYVAGVNITGLIASNNVSNNN